MPPLTTCLNLLSGHGGLVESVGAVWLVGVLDVLGLRVPDRDPLGEEVIIAPLPLLSGGG